MRRVRVTGLLLLLTVSGCVSQHAYASPDNRACQLSPAAIAHIIRWEVGSEAQYTRRYQRPVCPACNTTASGPTIGVGYDLGHTYAAVIRNDWRAHPQVDRLPAGAGITGKDAIPVTASMQDVITPWSLALPVFQQTSVLNYCRMTIRAYPGSVDLPPDAFGILVATSMNRGTGMAGDRRRELREIRSCTSAKDLQCIADQLVASTRLWANTEAGNGLRNRYLDAARIVRGQ